MKAAIATPAGQVGRHVVRYLLGRGVPVVLLALERHRERLASFTERGAEIRITGLDDAAGLVSALRGVDSLFWLTPPDLSSELKGWYRRTAEAAARAVRANEVTRVVNLSSLGAGMRPGLGTVSYVGETELVLQEAAPNIVHLRPGYFMENLLLQEKGIGEGKLRLPFSAEHDLPWISASDIGAAAGQLLADATWRGQWVKHLMGPENLTAREVANILTKVTGKSVRYEQATLAEVEESLLASGLTPVVAGELVSTFAALGDPEGIYAIPRTHDTFTPTSLEDFLRSSLLRSGLN